jgi:cytoskeletal protein CcmA (bactofilin family)
MVYISAFKEACSLAGASCAKISVYRVQEDFSVFGRTTAPNPSRPNEMQPPTSPGSFVPPTDAAATPKPPVLTPAGASSDVPTSVIGKDLHIGGEKIIIVCESRLQVDGEIVGDLAGREVIIGETASVTGSVAADTIEVHGKVNGAIRGAKVALKPSAKVDGDIVHQVLTIAEGAHFDGRVRRAKDDDEIRPQLILPTG